MSIIDIKHRGSITVFLSLILTIIIALIMTLFQGSIIQTRKNECVMIGNSTINSVFAEYNKDLLDDFGILCLDGGYLGEYNEAKIKDRFRYYASDTRKDSFAGVPNIDDINIKGMRLITDNNGNLFRNQACKYALSKLGADVISKYINQDIIDKLAEEETKYTTESQSNQNDIDDIIEDNLDKNINLEEGNVLGEIKKYKSLDLLDLVLANDKISSKEINLSNVPSNRKLRQGYGEAPIRSYSSKFEDNVLFYSYIMSQFSNYTNNTSDKELDYEVEYIIGGKSSDRENLKAVFNKIILIRQGANFSYLVSNQVKNAEALELATSIVGIFGLPPLITLTKYAILLAWAYAESVVDVRDLLSGNKVPIFKDDSTWKVSISNISSLTGSSANNSQGLEYKDYLSLLLLTSSSNNITLRALDIIERRERAVKGNYNFKIDNMIESINFDINWEIMGFGYKTKVDYIYD